MATSCAFLELPPELRNIIYEYVALDEDAFHIKTRVRPKNGCCIAARSGLVLANRQISDEYIPVMQTVSLWPGIKLHAWVRDFNFRHLERWLAALQPYQPASQDDIKSVKVHLTITAIDNMHMERYASWMSLLDHKGLSISYEVDEASSGHAFPLAPPLDSDLAMARLRTRDCEDENARILRLAVVCFQQSRLYACYRLRSHDPSKQHKFMAWLPKDTRADGSYKEILEMFIPETVTDVWVD